MDSLQYPSFFFHSLENYVVTKPCIKCCMKLSRLASLVPTLSRLLSLSRALNSSPPSLLFFSLFHPSFQSAAQGTRTLAAMAALWGRGDRVWMPSPQLAVLVEEEIVTARLLRFENEEKYVLWYFGNKENNINMSPTCALIRNAPKSRGSSLCVFPS